MFDISIAFALLPRYWRIGFASIESDDLDPDYYVTSYTFWLFVVGFTLTVSVGKHD